VVILMFTQTDGDDNVIRVPNKKYKRGKLRSDISRENEKVDKTKSLSWQLKNARELKNKKMSITCRRCHKLIIEIRIMGFNVKDLWIIDAICRQCKTDLNPKSTGKFIEDESQVKIEDLMVMYGDEDNGERKDNPDTIDGGRLRP